MEGLLQAGIGVRKTDADAEALLESSVYVDALPTALMLLGADADQTQSELRSIPNGILQAGG